MKSMVLPARGSKRIAVDEFLTTQVALSPADSTRKAR